MSHPHRRILAACLTVAVTLAACNRSDSADTTSVSDPRATSTTAAGDAGDAAVAGDADVLTPLEADEDAPRPFRVEVLERRPVPDPVFTQGLELDGASVLVSGGLYGESSIRRLSLDTLAAEVAVPLDDDLFGEGVTRVGDRLIQLTWRAGRALVWDRLTLEPLGELSYAGEGWGICALDDTSVVTSDGSHLLTQRDAEDFSVTSQVEVLVGGQPLDQINELECVDGLVWANEWMSDTLWAIDPTSGQVTARVDARGLIEPHPALSDANHVLNGIAHVPGTDTFWITGKEWPEMLLVRFVEADG